MLTRTVVRLSLLSAASMLGALLALNEAIAADRPAGAQARSDGPVLVAERGQNRARQQQRHVQDRDGSRHTEVQRTENGHTSHSTWTGENGKTATRDANVVNDREAGTRTRGVTSTGPEGKTRTVNDVTTRTEDGHTRNTTYTDAEGRTATRDAVVTRNSETGTRTKDATYVSRDGKQTTVNDVTQRTESGYTRNTTVTRPNGETGTRSVDVSCDKAAGNCTKDVQVNKDSN